MIELVLLALVAVAVLAAAILATRKLIIRLRRGRLMDRFDDPVMVDTIMEGRIARGMSSEMVIAAWGEPADMDETVLKTKSKHEMKYEQTGKNRFARRVHLEDGQVVGWEIK